MNRRTIAILAALLAAATLGPATSAQVDTGSADMSRMVFLGDSLVSGEASASVVETFQVHSFPALIYAQVNGGSAGFEQALVSEPGLPARLILGPDFTPISIPLPDGVPTNADLPRPYDNLGISGGYRAEDLTTVDGLATCEAINAFLIGIGAPPRLGCERVNLVLRDGGTAVAQALSLEPTFVVLWVGGNDILRAALGGTFIEGITATPVAQFETAYRAAVDALTSGGAGLAVANIPDVADLPFLNTIPPVVVDPVTREPVLIGGAPVPLQGPGGAPLSLADKVTLLASSFLAAGCGIPDALDGGFDAGVCPDGFLPGSVIVDVTEQGLIGDRVDALNAVIAQVAQENGAALYDFASAFSRLNAEGLNLGGVEYTTDFITGGLVSFDGFHPNPLISAINANGFIEAINETYGANIPPVDLYPYVFGNAGNIGPPPGLIGLSAATMDSIRGSLMLPMAGALEEFERIRRTPLRRRNATDARTPAVGEDRTPDLRPIRDLRRDRRR